MDQATSNLPVVVINDDGNELQEQRLLVVLANAKFLKI